MELAQGAIGSVGKYDLSFAGGDLVVEVDATAPGAIGSAGLVVKLDGSAVCDALAKAIPGTIDDAIFAVIKSALKALSQPPAA